MRYTPSEKELDGQVKLVEVRVWGDYIARLDEKRRTSKRYEIDVLVPSGYTASDVKRQTPKALMASKEYKDFMVMRTFNQDGKEKKTEKTAKLRDLYSQRDIDRFRKNRSDAEQEQRAEHLARSSRKDGVGDTTEYEDETGLPRLVGED